MSLLLSYRKGLKNSPGILLRKGLRILALLFFQKKGILVLVSDIVQFRHNHGVTLFLSLP